MLIALVFFPVFSIIIALVLYQYNGRRQFFKFDLVQFLYAFVLAPAVFIWLKTLLFYILNNELNIRISPRELFVRDTVYSLVAFFVLSFIVIHALTKSFELQRLKDPNHDVFKHSEFFHLATSHAVIYAGVMVLFTFLSFTNVYFPLEVKPNPLGFYVILTLGLILGIASFGVMILSDWGNPKFIKLTKLLFLFFFIIHVAIFFLANPPTSTQVGIYWFVFSIFTGFVLSMVTIGRSKRAMDLFKKFHYEGKLVLNTARAGRQPK